MKRDEFRFFDRLRVRWAEVDMQKIVFNGHYLMYFDTAVASYWRALAMPYHDAMQRLQGDLYVRKATVEYLGSARYDDVCDVGLRCEHIGNSSMRFVAALFRDDAVLVHGELVYVFADPASQTSRPVPEALRALLLGFEQGQPMLDWRAGGWAALGDSARAVRQAVYVDELKLDAGLAADDDDLQAITVVAFNRLQMPVCTGRLLRQTDGTMKIGRLAVPQALRGSGIGRELLARLMSAAREAGARRVVLHARQSAQAFYARAGFTPSGVVFEEAGQLHVEMRVDTQKAL
jgi:YbgC/YbaW family acyl-CoA thioester hydrolase